MNCDEIKIGMNRMYIYSILKIKVGELIFALVLKVDRRPTTTRYLYHNHKQRQGQSHCILQD
jgi:hypothetical protein